MSSKINRPAYEQLIREDVEWLLAQPRSLERDHIKVVLEWSVDANYPPPAAQPEPQVGDLWCVPGKPETVRHIRAVSSKGGAEFAHLAWHGRWYDSPAEWQAWVASGAVLLWREGA